MATKARHRAIPFITCCVLMIVPLAYGQQVTSTINGRILDQGDAALPGVTVTVTNVGTGVVRTTVTNEQGQYSIPGLETGTYRLETDLGGFASAMRDNVRLDVNATLTVDFRLALANLTETLTVTGQAPLIETTQSKMANTIGDDRGAEPADDLHGEPLADWGAGEDFTFASMWTLGPGE